MHGMHLIYIYHMHSCIHMQYADRCVLLVAMYQCNVMSFNVMSCHGMYTTYVYIHMIDDPYWVSGIYGISQTTDELLQQRFCRLLGLAQDPLGCSPSESTRKKKDKAVQVKSEAKKQEPKTHILFLKNQMKPATFAEDVDM